MSKFIITTESNTSNYIVAVEDDFGFIPLYATDDFDSALGLVKSLEVLPTYFTHQTDFLMAAN